MSFGELQALPMPVFKPKAFSVAEVDAVQEELKRLPYFHASAQVGSSYIVGEGLDLDIVAYLKMPEFITPDMQRWASQLGYTYTGKESGDEDEFHTFRKGDVNLMLTDDENFYDRFRDAAEVCKHLWKTYTFGDKVLRIKIHRILMNGEAA